MGHWPNWAVVLACGVVAQIAKMVVYSVTNRQWAVPVIVQSHGLPSLPAALLSCLLAVTVMGSGWASGEAGFALVFMVIVVHDTIKLRLAARQQREALYHLVVRLPDAGPMHQRVAGYLDPRTHHPSHVLVGGVFGVLFALAIGMGQG